LLRFRLIHLAVGKGSLGDSDLGSLRLTKQEFFRSL
jgi:hypothetical protein